MALKISGTNVIDDSLVAVLDATYVKTMTVSELTPNVMGESSAYTTGGYSPSGNLTTIDNFPFATPTTPATGVGNLSQATGKLAGTNSATDGYTSGGTVSGGSTNQIRKFPFSSTPISVSNVGALSGAYKSENVSQGSSTDGYSAGGWPGPSNVIDRFPFSTPFTTATDVGDLSQARFRSAAQSSKTDGYTSGGDNTSGSGYVNTIDKFPFSTPFTTATDIGDLNIIRQAVAGQNSSTDGYSSGGTNPSFPTAPTIIDRFPFSTPFTTATDVGSLSVARRFSTGQSSTTYGYTSGGSSPSNNYLNTIDRFPFSTPFTTATDVGDLSQTRANASGQQD